VANGRELRHNFNPPLGFDITFDEQKQFDAWDDKVPVSSQFQMRSAKYMCKVYNSFKLS
jgi:hypothetical protein